MSEAVPPSPASARLPASFRLRGGEAMAARIVAAAGLSLLCAALLVALSGHSPLAAFGAMALGSVG